MMTDFDVTTNRIPFELLTEDEQTTLTHWHHGWEVYTGHSDWCQIDSPSWVNDLIYRGNPAPVVTSKWFNVYPRCLVAQGYSTRKKADDISGIDRIAVLRIDTCNSVSTAHLEGV